MFINKTISFFALLGILLFSACGADKTDITLLHFNDFHAQISPLKVKWTPNMSFRSAPKAAGIARMIHQLKTLKNKNTLVLSAGDMLMGSPFSTIFKGKATFSLFNGLIDYMVIGNHEFDYDQPNLKILMKIAGFKIFTSNVFTKEGKPYTKDRFYIRTVNGIKVGIFGLTTSETPVTTYPKYVAGLTFKNEIKVAREMVKLLKSRGAEMIVALNHVGLGTDETLAEDVKGIDIIIGGHSHSITNNYRIKNTWIAQAGSSSRYLGKIDIAFDKSSKKITSVRSILIPLKKKLPQDKPTLTKIAQFRKKLDKALLVVVGETKVLMDGMRSVVRSLESNLPNYITDTIMMKTGSDMAFINGGGVRDSIQKGKIRVMDIIKVLPFNNTIITMKLKGSLILSMLKKSASLGQGAGGMLHVSKGLKYKMMGQTLESSSYKGKPINPNRLYKVATSSFMAAGGDGYSEFKKGIQFYDTGITMADALQKRIMKEKVINPGKDGRLERD